MTVKDVILVAKKVGAGYCAACRSLLCKFDISQPELDILLFLSQCPDGGFAKDICESRCIKPNVVSVNVDKLVQEGYLERSTVENDRRKVRLTCTEKAEPIVREGIRVQEGFLEKLCIDISREELCILEDIIKKLGNNADKASAYI